jgi:hypothetical protein
MAAEAQGLEFPYFHRIFWICVRNKTKPGTNALRLGAFFFFVAEYVVLTIAPPALGLGWEVLPHSRAVVPASCFARTRKSAANRAGRAGQLPRQYQVRPARCFGTGQAIP